MRLDETPYHHQLPVDGYGPGFFRVGGEIYKGGIFVHDRQVQSWAGYDKSDDLIECAKKYDLLLMGTGIELRPVPEILSAQIEASGSALECMPSPSACRTFNVLIAENRSVMLACLAI